MRILNINKDGGWLNLNFTAGVYSVCVEAVNCGPVLLHQCVAIFFCSSGIMNCILFTFENNSNAHALVGVCCVVFIIISDEQLHQTEAAVVPMLNVHSDDFPFSRIKDAFIL